MIQSVERAVRVLEQLDAGECGVHELARRLDLKVSTVHSFLKTLTALGYAERGEGGRYRLGRGAMLLGMRRSVQSRLIAAGKLALTGVLEEIDETVVLADYSGGKWRELINAASSRPLHVRPEGLESDNLYRSATGRVILANLDREALADYLSRRGLPFREWEGIDEAAELERRLDLVRRRGCEIILKGELCAIAVPLFDPDRLFAAALGAWLPASRATREHQQAILRALTAGAARIIAEY